jgi:hypothetical protein
MASQDFLSDIQSLVDSSKKKTPDSNKDVNVTFNMRVYKSLRDEFHELCHDNHTTMSREVKRYMRLAIAKQKL